MEGKTIKNIKLESLNDPKFQVLPDDEFAEIQGGRLFGFSVRYADQVLASIGGQSQTGDYGNFYFFGIKGKNQFRNEDQVDD